MSTPTGAYQLAKVVAARIAERPGLTARELYKLFGTGFAEFGCDGSAASAMIAQHLAKFESDGLVISERTGRKPNDPRKWTWIGPKPKISETAPMEKQQETDMRDAADEAISCGALEEVTAEPAADIHPGDLLDPADDLDRALITVRQAARAMARPPIDRRDEKIACLARLAEITAPDIAELLRDIAEDIK